MTTHHDLQVVCETCTQPISDGDGAVWVDHVEAGQHALRKHARQAERSNGEIVMHTAAELSDDFLARFEGQPDFSLWRSHHYACASLGISTYCIPVEELRTFVDVLNWTAHLLEKPWLSGTNWYSMLRVCTGKTKSRAGLLPAWHRR